MFWHCKTMNHSFIQILFKIVLLFSITAGDTTIGIGDGKNPKQCSANVLAYRSQYEGPNPTRNKTHQVESSVELGSAMIIFILVGVVTLFKVACP